MDLTPSKVEIESRSANIALRARWQRIAFGASSLLPAADERAANQLRQILAQANTMAERADVYIRGVSELRVSEPPSHPIFKALEGK